ncbi:MAG: hypothetical protein A3I63_06110 [Betaproteobacteria bacterium RIFCSPLOWO2_02_FULL_66_14]|nr:MAG: hypothetical protein A3I63_06110 [Betaproteobacteria bacterium RIFCSPLOWO2_02_FULL_66_14]
MTAELFVPSPPSRVRAAALTVWPPPLLNHAKFPDPEAPPVMTTDPVLTDCDPNPVVTFVHVFVPVPPRILRAPEAVSVCVLVPACTKSEPAMVFKF